MAWDVNVLEQRESLCWSPLTHWPTFWAVLSSQWSLAIQKLGDPILIRREENGVTPFNPLP